HVWRAHSGHRRSGAGTFSPQSDRARLGIAKQRVFRVSVLWRSFLPKLIQRLSASGRPLLADVPLMKIFLYYIGKARDQHANGFDEEFIKRTTRYCQCEMREIHPDRVDLWTKHPSAAKILLDPAG